MVNPPHPFRSDLNLTCLLCSFVADRVKMPQKRKAPRTTQQSAGKRRKPPQQSAGKRRKPTGNVIPGSSNAPSLEAPLSPTHAQPRPDVSVSATTSTFTAPASATAPPPCDQLLPCYKVVFLTCLRPFPRLHTCPYYFRVTRSLQLHLLWGPPLVFPYHSLDVSFGGGLAFRLP